ncbi:hypothetical protein SEA_MORGANA_160 [Gordonia phage Morgana]|uniref:DUF2786 domain-containing protein n=1 Tax=Gordonia phage Morgana TaxID=3137292 RepID=A0AAX4RB11_9CAUD
MNDSDKDKVLRRIRGLFAKARSVAGTPEADTYNEHAFELLSQYGIDEQLARLDGSDESIADDKVVKVVYTFDGDYGASRRELVWAIVTGLHCKSIYQRDANGRDAIAVIGVRRHIMRAKLYTGFLEPQMLAAAAKVTNTMGVAFNARDLTQLRAEYMEGWAREVGMKINSVELAALRQFDRNAGDTRMALQRSTDEARARKAFDKLFPPAMRKSVKAGRTGTAAYRAGQRDGSTVDVGQTRMGAGSGARALV